MSTYFNIQQRNRAAQSSSWQQMKTPLTSNTRIFILVCLLSLVLSTLPQAVHAQEEQPAAGAHTLFLPITVAGGSRAMAETDTDNFVSPNEDDAAWAEYTRLAELVEPRLTLSSEGVFELVPPLSEAEIGNSTLLYADILATVEGVNAKLDNNELTPTDLNEADGRFSLASLTSALAESDFADDETDLFQARSSVAVPADVGDYGWARDYCNRYAVVTGLAALTPTVGWIMGIVSVIGTYTCHQSLDRLRSLYVDAYRSAPPTDPGYPINDIHAWKSVVIQDFREGTWAWGDGAIIKRSQGGPRPYYVGGYGWYAFKRATNVYNVFPGYPLNTEHGWGRVHLQDFDGGDWGRGAIIINLAPGIDSRQRAYLVAGNIWRAYVEYGGQNNLGHPTGFARTIYNNNDRGYWLVQYFQDGEIWTQGRTAKVVSYSNWQWRYFFY